MVKEQQLYPNNIVLHSTSDDVKSTSSSFTDTPWQVVAPLPSTTRIKNILSAP